MLRRPSALVLASLRWCYAKFRECEGLGFGDVKLAAAVGLGPGPGDTVVFRARGRRRACARFGGETIDARAWMKIPFGAFLCPALWFVFHAGVLPP